MTDDELRVKIAEVRGWKLVDLPHHPNGRKVLWMTPEGKQLQSGTPKTVPDYLNDLNEMHEAEKTLTDEQRRPYHERLAIILRRDGGNQWPYHATARQRAEAFANTLGLTSKA